MFLLVHKIQWSLTEILIDGWHAVFKNLMIFDWLTTQISTDSNKLDGLFNGWLTFPLVQKKLMIFDWYSRLIWWLINIPSTSKYLMIFDGWLTYSPSDSKKNHLYSSYDPLVQKMWCFIYIQNNLMIFDWCSRLYLTVEIQSN